MRKNDKFGLPQFTEGKENTNLTNHNREIDKKYFTDEIIAVPNPFNNSTELNFSLGSDQQIQLRIFILAGRLID